MTHTAVFQDSTTVVGHTKPSRSHKKYIIMEQVRVAIIILYPLVMDVALCDWYVLGIKYGFCKVKLDQYFNIVTQVTLIPDSSSYVMTIYDW